MKNKLKNFFINIKDFFEYTLWFKVINKIINKINIFKWKCQRFHRGYADIDTWDIDIWFVKTIVPMLKSLRNNMHVYPNELTPKKWNSIITKIIEGFEIADRILTGYAMFDEDYEKLSEESANKDFYKKIAIVSKKKYDIAFKLFHKYFFNLWD